MKRCEASMIAKFIGILVHQFNDKLTKNEMKVIDPDRLIKICDYIINGVIWVDTHVAVRRDLVLFEMVHDLLSYEKYKELVFSTVCRTTRVYSNGFFGVFHDPLAEACCDLWLEEEDYRVLCQEIFCDE